MNKKGFTLVELLAVIALLAIISGLAIPNVISSINNSNKNTFYLDAKRMISKAEALLSVDKTARRNLTDGSSRIYTFNELNVDEEFQKDADGGIFEGSNSTDPNQTFVKVTKREDRYEYCICVVGSKRKITGTSKNCSLSNTDSSIGCIVSTSLTGIDVVEDK